MKLLKWFWRRSDAYYWTGYLSAFCSLYVRDRIRGVHK